MSAFTIRRALPEDAAACAAILAEWIEQTDWFPRSNPASADRPFVAAKIKTEVVSVAVASTAKADTTKSDTAKSGPVAGFIALDGGYVSCLYVGSTYRGFGVGRALLDVAKQAVPRLSLWTFQANLDAQRFYLREGFTELRRTSGMDNAEQLPDIEYIWTREADT